MVYRHRIVSATVVLCALVSSAGAGNLPTVFTYQGRLDEGGSPAEGLHDFTFALWDSLAGGLPVSAVIGVNDVPVADGLFTVQLDFGAVIFDGSARFLEIKVEGVTLSPRQSITATPYALQTRGIFVDNSLNVGLGTTAPLNQLHVRGVQATLRLEATDDPMSFTEVKDAQATQLRINKVNNNGLVLLDINPNAGKRREQRLSANFSRDQHDRAQESATSPRQQHQPALRPDWGGWRRLLLPGPRRKGRHRHHHADLQASRCAQQS